MLTEGSIKQKNLIILLYMEKKDLIHCQVFHHGLSFILLNVYFMEEKSIPLACILKGTS